MPLLISGRGCQWLPLCVAEKEKGQHFFCLPGENISRINHVLSILKRLGCKKGSLEKNIGLKVTASAFSSYFLRIQQPRWNKLRIGVGEVFLFLDHSYRRSKGKKMCFLCPTPLSWTLFVDNLLCFHLSSGRVLMQSSASFWKIRIRLRFDISLSLVYSISQ